MKLIIYYFRNLESISLRKKKLFTILLLFVVCTSFSQQHIKGTIKDRNNLPIPGVSVLEKQTNNSTVTDFDGNYEIISKGENPTLVFSFVGFKTQEIKVGSKILVNVVLETAVNDLAEVVVMGYGTQKKSQVTTAIASIKAKDFTQGAVRDASELIVGKVAGLVISNGSGDPLAGPSVSLRGVASLQGAATPLILINGIPGSFDSVAPNDIASIDVLKDASASAIYGTRGANGVILITTKTVDRDVPTTLSYSGYTAMSSFAKKANFLDAGQYQKLLADGVKMPFKDEGYSTNWLDEISRTAMNTNHNINMKGGSAKSNYIANINYGNQEGVFLGSYTKELRLSFDVNHYMFNDKLKFNLNIVRGTFDSGGFDTNVYRQALIRNPTARPQNDDGSWTQTSRFQYSNPVASINETQRMNEGENTRLSAGLTLTLLPGWDTDLRLSNVKNTGLHGYYETKRHYSNTIQGRNGYASRSDDRSNLDLLELTSKYAKTIDKHIFSVLGGYSYQYSMSQSGYANNYNFPTDAFSYNNMGAGQALLDGKAGMGSHKEDNKLIGFFGRGSYSFDNKYHLLASVRREGSSKFGYNYQWGTFPAVSAGWTISNESFLKEVSFINNLKLRAGYGETGIIPNDSYASLTLLNYEGYVYDNGSWIQGLVPASNPNPDLRWEKSAEINLGIDFTFLKNRISGSVDVYHKKTKDMLWRYNVPQPPNLYNITLANVGKMENKGIEILLNTVPVKLKDFEWNSNMTLSHNKNKLTSLSNDFYKIEGNFINRGDAGDPISFSTHRLEVGQPIGNFWGLKSVDITTDGKWIIETKDGTRKTLTETLYNDDNKQYLGNGIPKFNAGWTNTFKYKRFDLGVVLVGAFGFQILNYQRMFYENPTINYNMLASSQDLVYGKAKLNYPQTYVSYYIEDGDYVKINNVTFGYNLDVKKLKFITSARIYASGSNLATITNYKGIDPELSSGDGGLTTGNDSRDKYPTTRTFTLGINLNF